MNFLERIFKIKEYGTTVKQEIYTGVVTFLAVSYILAVNPDILSSTGMDRGGSDLEFIGNGDNQVFSITIANPVKGAYYTPFVVTDLNQKGLGCCN